jgi:hypothetical protein
VGISLGSIEGRSLSRGKTERLSAGVNKQLLFSDSVLVSQLERHNPRIPVAAMADKCQQDDPQAGSESRKKQRLFLVRKEGQMLTMYAIGKIGSLRWDCVRFFCLPGGQDQNTVSFAVF